MGGATTSLHAARLIFERRNGVPGRQGNRMDGTWNRRWLPWRMTPRRPGRSRTRSGRGEISAEDVRACGGLLPKRVKAEGGGGSGQDDPADCAILGADPTDVMPADERMPAGEAQPQYGERLDSPAGAALPGRRTPGQLGGAALFREGECLDGSAGASHSREGGCLDGSAGPRTPGRRMPGRLGGSLRTSGSTRRQFAGQPSILPGRRT